MNPNKDKRLAEASGYNPFWICFTVFLLLAGDYGLRFVGLLNQRDQLNQARLIQTQNLEVLTQARQLEARLEAFSLELLQLARTNAAASQVVQEFNIQWTPGPGAPAPATARTNPIR
ncbi:MAG TPA: hypothetical protein PKI20_21120 [Verrucomicrobiota bacterium]|jgi:hypothetical protein|nr:hypothetical protein [Verrucomicrobiota bacterium]HQL80254.1 hypothetical protein [Verrucomicrobiota bacterium]